MGPRRVEGRAGLEAGAKVRVLPKWVVSAVHQRCRHNVLAAVLPTAGTKGWKDSGAAPCPSGSQYELRLRLFALYMSPSADTLRASAQAVNGGIALSAVHRCG